MTALMISNLESGRELSPKDINLYKAMLLLNTALKSITNQTIINCFKKAKFVFESESEEEFVDINEEIDQNLWGRLKTLTTIGFNTFENYILVDEEEKIEFTGELSDEEIVRQVLNEDNEEPSETADFETIETIIEPITNSQALEAIDVLQRYFGQIGDKEVDVKLTEIQRKVTQNTFKCLKQTKITDFFS